MNHEPDVREMNQMSNENQLYETAMVTTQSYKSTRTLTIRPRLKSNQSRKSKLERIDVTD